MNIQETPFCDKKSWDQGDLTTIRGEEKQEWLAMNKSDAQKLERLINRIALEAERLKDSPLSLLATMVSFSENWKTDRSKVLV